MRLFFSILFFCLILYLGFYPHQLNFEVERTPKIDEYYWDNSHKNLMTSSERFWFSLYGIKPHRKNPSLIEK